MKLTDEENSLLDSHISQEEIEEIKKELKLHQPIIVQCVVCEINIVHYVETARDQDNLCVGCSDISWMIAMKKKLGRNR